MVRILLFALLLAGCSSEQTPFCKCIESGEVLSEYSSKLFQKEVTSEDEVIMDDLRAKKEKDCKEFENLTDDKIQALKEECEQLNQLDMIGIALIFFMGKWVYKLAEEFGKNKWLFAILGVISFYATQFILGIILGFAMGDSFFEISELTLNIIGIVVGFAGVWTFRSILKYSWKKEALRSPSTELLDDASNFS